MKTDIWSGYVRVFGGRDDWFCKLEDWDQVEELPLVLA